jgi:hypothetical protein
MPTLNLDRLKKHRARTYNLPPSKSLTTPNQALRFVQARGFVYFWPIKGIDLPSLWVAVAGDRPVADQHDDPGHVTWGWKDGALGKRTWYYGKILRHKATIIALETAPYFYALSENYGSPEEDYLVAYHEGRLTQPARQIYEALLEHGALNSIDLRRTAKLANAKESEFNKGLDQLQADFKILPIGVAEAGAWRYSHIYEMTVRHFPELVEQARTIGESQARSKLLELYFASVGAAQVRDVIKLFGWSREVTERTINKMISEESLVRTSHPKHEGAWLALPFLAS